MNACKRKSGKFYTNTYNFVLLQLDVLLAPELLQEFIPLDQLPLDLDGHYMYNHEEWIRFHVVCFSEPLIDSGNTVYIY